MRDEPSGTAGAQQVTAGRFKRFEAREFMGGCTVGTQDLVLPFTKNLSIDLNKKSLYFHFSLEKREFNRFTNLGCFQPFVLPCHREHELVVSVRRPPICVNIRYKVWPKVWPPLIGVGTTTQVAPPSEPGRRISGTRLSSWWLLQRRSASHGMRLF